MYTQPLSLWDYLIIVSYLSGCVLIGARTGRRSHEAQQFLLAGRRLTLPIFVATLVASWYGGILGVTEIAFTDGLVTWITQGGFWYITYVIFALFLAPRLTAARQTSLPDQVGLFHGEGARRVATVLNFLNVVPIAYVLSLGILVEIIFGWPLWIGVIAGMLLVAGYSAMGGFRAVVYTDILHFSLMYSGVLLVIPFAATQLGGLDFLRTHLPPEHLHARGAISQQELLVWALIAFSTLVDPNFYQCCYAAKSPRVAQWGVGISILFWMLFDCCTTLSGLYARAALPQARPREAYPRLALSLLPTGCRGVFVAGALATIMSTIDSYCFIGGLALSYDIWAHRRKPPTERSLVFATRVGILLSALLAAALAFVFHGSFKAIWITIGSLTTASLTVPLLIGFSGWRPRNAGLAAMIAGAGMMLLWTIAREVSSLAWVTATQPLLPGLLCSLLAYLGVGLRRRTQ